ncbi:uncharacterized protein LOC129596304 isoform X2 [Paramacrobiotus metropolitanus]|uniref:uncharacterized protein LOC129596304 isoform X2 n=1 Tax=Paramacrobiotus metropolitanus TaxID=2943436 RepID=UPI002445B7DF|nr:uncharacterized protein LOC129596304 isoform X2 [Paramacrobiotus metropolitanus]
MNNLHPLLITLSSVLLACSKQSAVLAQDKLHLIKRDVKHGKPGKRISSSLPLPYISSVRQPIPDDDCTDIDNEDDSDIVPSFKKATAPCQVKPTPPLATRRIFVTPGKWPVTQRPPPRVTEPDDEPDEPSTRRRTSATTPDAPDDETTPRRTTTTTRRTTPTATEETTEEPTTTPTTTTTRKTTTTPTTIEEPETTTTPKRRRSRKRRATTPTTTTTTSSPDYCDDDDCEDEPTTVTTTTRRRSRKTRRRTTLETTTREEETTEAPPPVPRGAIDPSRTQRCPSNKLVKIHNRQWFTQSSITTDEEGTKTFMKTSMIYSKVWSMPSRGETKDYLASTIVHRQFAGDVQAVATLTLLPSTRIFQTEYKVQSIFNGEVYRTKAETRYVECVDFTDSPNYRKV